MRVPRISLGKLFNVLQSPIGRMASWPMRNIETFPSKQMYLYISLVERKVAEFYHNIDRGRYLVWFKLLIFMAFSGQLMVSLKYFIGFTAELAILRKIFSFLIFICASN